jgi:hypothetical protein
VNIGKTGRWAIRTFVKPREDAEEAILFLESEWSRQAFLALRGWNFEKFFAALPVNVRAQLVWQAAKLAVSYLPEPMRKPILDNLPHPQKLEEKMRQEPR